MLILFICRNGVCICMVHVNYNVQIYWSLSSGLFEDSSFVMVVLFNCYNNSHPRTVGDFYFPPKNIHFGKILQNLKILNQWTCFIHIDIDECHMPPLDTECKNKLILKENHLLYARIWPMLARAYTSYDVDTSKHRILLTFA